MKRESRLARERSEDAVSWNVFRYLERNDLLAGFLSSATSTHHETADVIYWSYSQQENGSWTELNDARREFGEKPEQGSEPDLIVRTDTALFFVEAKLTAGNRTTPTNKDDAKKYLTGGGNWFSSVFNSDYATVAIAAEKYELMRFWLLGTWMASQLVLDFYLINLVLDNRETNIEAAFKPHIVESANRRFMRLTWEDIFKFVLSAEECKEKAEMVVFFENKTVGYVGGKLQRAFCKPTILGA